MDRFSPGHWLADGTIVFGTDPGDIGVIPIDGDDPARMLLQASWLEPGPSVSPDGRWLAYLSDRNGSLHPDGRFLIAEAEGLPGAAEFDGSSRLVVVTNRFTRLRKRMSEN